MIQKTVVFLLGITFILCGQIAGAQQSGNRNENQESAEEAARRRAAELAKIERITVDELKSKIEQKKPIYILDVRMPDDYQRAEKQIKNSVRMSPYDLKDRMNEIPKDREIITYCT